MPLVHLHLFFPVKFSYIGALFHSNLGMSFRFPMKSPSPGIANFPVMQDMFLMMQVNCLRLLGVVGSFHHGLWPLVHVNWELGSMWE